MKKMLLCAFIGSLVINCSGGKDNSVQLEPRATFVYLINSKVANTNPNVSVYFMDLFDTSKTRIQDLQNSNKIVICYFSAGTLEDWRSDASDFPESAVGTEMEEWPGEFWLDYRNSEIREIMNARMDLAKEKGCNGVDPDNVDGHTNSTGFDLSAEDQKNFLEFLSDGAKDRNLKIGLKNSPNTADQLVSLFDFVVTEECHRYEECDSYSPFASEGKPIFSIEYQEKKVTWCNQAIEDKSTLIFADYDLTEFEYCFP